METNAKIDKLLLDINAAFDSLLERKGEFDAASVKDAFQGSMKTQMTLMKMLDALRDEVKSRIGIDRAKGTYPAYDFTCRTMREFIETKFKTKDLAFGQLTEQFIHDYENFILDEKGYAVDTVRHYHGNSQENVQKGLSGRTLRAVHVPALRPPETDRQDSQGTVP